MITVAVVTRRLREGKTYEDFRRAWFHTVGFGTGNRMLTFLNSTDPREITVIGLTDTSREELAALFDIDVQQRLANPLDDVIEPEMERRFGVLVAEDDFSGTGELAYQAATVNGEPMDEVRVAEDLSAVQRALLAATAARDRARSANG